MNSQLDRERLIELVGRLCDEEIGDAEVSELEAMLKQHEEARRLYHLTVALHRDLELCDIGEAQSAESVSVDSCRHQTADDALAGVATDNCRRRWIAPVFAACALIAMTFVGYPFYRDGEPAAPTIATVTEVVNAEWGSEASSIGLGDGVAAGRIQLTSGTICLTFHHGVVMTVESPADLELLDRENVSLHDGRIVAYVPDGAEGFTVTTDAAKVVDLGTEFAVATSEDGSSEVTVFDGEVELAATNATDTTPRRVVAGLAWRVGADGESSQEEFRPSAFESARTVIRQRRVIRESFRVDRSFPGEARNGWTSPWSVDAENLSVDEDATGIRTEEPLAPGTRNYLTVRSKGASDTASGRLQLTRSYESFDAFDVTEPYTIECLLRLESDPATIEQIRVFGVQVPVDPSSDRADWEIAASKKSEQQQPHWRLYRPRETRFNTLPLVQDQTYRFLIEVHPQLQKWRASVSDGTRSIWNTLKDGSPLRLRPDEQPDRNLLGCELTTVPGSELRFSLDAIRIQNNPTATAPESQIVE